MLTINRTAIVVLPRHRFLDWLYEADPTSVEMSLEDLQREPTIYLLPESGSEQQARTHLRKRCEEIFKEQLDGWYRLPSSWPKRRDFDAFSQWFQWSIHSDIIDLCHGPLVREEM